MFLEKLLKKINLKSSLILFGIFLFSIILFIYPEITFAWFEKITAGIPLAFISIFISITKGLALLSGALLDWITTGNLIGWGYTNNTVVNLGLGITKQFVNLGIVTVLIVVSLLITLNYKAYDGKKILAKLILVALLVNFAPVLVGLIVDASNITMNYFFVGIKNGISGILNNSLGSSDGIIKQLGEINTYTEGFSLIIRACVSVIFNISLCFAFLILFLVFLFRYIAIWFLTILSPLAFVAWIMPNTKKYWDMWWQQLIQWSIIGIPMAFFLYLAVASYQAIAVNLQSNIAMPGIDNGTTDWFNSTFPYIIVLVMLYLGFILGLKTSAMGATSIINFASSKQKAVGKWATGKIWNKGIRPSIERPGRAAIDNISRGAARLGNISIPGLGKVPGLRRIKPLAPLKWVLGGGGFREAGNIRPAIEKAEADAKVNSGVASSNMIVTGTVKGTEATGEYIKTLKNNDAQDLFNVVRDSGPWKGKGKISADGKMTDEEIVQDKEFANIMAPILKDAQAAGMLGTIVRRDSRMAVIAAKKNIGGYGEIKDKNGQLLRGEALEAAAVSRAVNEARTHINDWEPEELNHKHVHGAVMANLEEDRLLQLSRSVKEGLKTFLDQGDKNFKEFVDSKSSIKSMSVPDKTRILSSKKGADYIKIWKEYEEDIKKLYGNNAGFTALKSKRVIEKGFRTFEYNTGATTADVLGINTPPPTDPTTPLQTMGDVFFGKIKEETEGLKTIGQKNKNTRQKSVAEEDAELKTIGKAFKKHKEK